MPPPYHGSNVMTKVMLSALRKQGYEIVFIDKSFAKSINSIGKPSIRKIFRVPILAIETVIACLLRHPSLCIYFIAVGKSAFIVDAFLLFLIRLCHIPYILRFGGKGYRKLKKENFVFNFFVYFTFSRALGGIVLGKSMKWDVNYFLPDDKLVYVPNGIPYKAIIAKKAYNEIIQILYLSNLIPTKGPFEVLKAAKIVTQRQQNVRFILAGADMSKSFTHKLKSYIDKEGLKKYVSMPGLVIGEQKNLLFRTSDIFVFPTYFEREIFAMVNVEAMSWGLPVISSFEGAIPEIVQDGITGFLVDPKSPEAIANKILILANNLDLRKKMGKKGREYFEAKFTFEEHSKSLNDAIRYFLKIKKE